MLDKREELKIQNPYDFSNFEYDMDSDRYLDDQGNLFTEEELQGKQKSFQEEYEKNAKVQEEAEKQELLHNVPREYYDEDYIPVLTDQRTEEEKYQDWLNSNPLKMRESVSEDIVEIDARVEGVTKAKGEVLAEPKHIGWDEAFADKRKDDSEKMADIRIALKKYHEVKGTPSEADALRDLITSCNTYTWMKISFLKFGKAKERLNEVKQLRERAKEELEKSPYKDVKSNIGLKDEIITEENVEKDSEPELIYRDQVARSYEYEKNF